MLVDYAAIKSWVLGYDRMESCVEKREDIFWGEANIWGLVACSESNGPEQAKRVAGGGNLFQVA